MIKNPLEGIDLDNYRDEEIEELLSKLTADEIEELNNDIDPDNQYLPPAQRCRDQTKKAPTGPFDREKLIKFIEDQSKQDKDWDSVPFEKKIRGKVFTKTEGNTGKASKELDDPDFDVEFDEGFSEALKNATEEQLVDLAAILGFNGMMNQVQYQASVENKEQMHGGFRGVAKAEVCKMVEHEPDNDTNIDDVISKLEKNDSGLVEANLNNLSDITPEHIKRLCDAVADNKHLKKLHCANIQLRSATAEEFVSALKKNSTLNVLNLESNFLTGDVLKNIVEAVCREGSAVNELRLSNQQQKVLGVRFEQELTNIILKNQNLLVLGIDLETADARIRIRDHLAENIDRLKRLTRGKEK